VARTARGVLSAHGGPRRGHYSLAMAMTSERPETKVGRDQEAAAETASPATDLPQDRVGRLRGGAAAADSRRLAQVGVALVLITLAALAVGFAVGGAHKNNQIDELHTQGVPVTVTVTGCLGLLGGSGSNAAGFSCHGSYTLRGHTYTESLPGSTFHRPGSTIPAVAVPGDPALVSPVSIVDAQHSSGSVYVLPAVFGGLFVVLAGFLLLRRRSGSATPNS
jgi:hypothetical protein